MRMDFGESQECACNLDSPRPDNDIFRSKWVRVPEFVQPPHFLGMKSVQFTC